MHSVEDVDTLDNLVHKRFNGLACCLGTLLLFRADTGSQEAPIKPLVCNCEAADRPRDALVTKARILGVLGETTLQEHQAPLDFLLQRAAKTTC